MKNHFLLAILVAAFPRLLMAQTSASGLIPRPFFLELRNAYNLYLIRYAAGSNVAYINPLPLTLGYYFTPRLAVQLSGTYGHSTNDWVLGTLTTADGVYTSFGNENHTHTAIPITMRYVLNKRQLQSRLQVDALLGLAWAYDSFTSFSQSTFTSTPNGISIPLRELRFSDHGSQFFATAGLSLRWRFYRSFEAVGDLSWNRNLDGPSPAESQVITGSRYGLTRNTSFGLRYRFNLRKPAPKPAS